MLYLLSRAAGLAGLAVVLLTLPSAPPQSQASAAAQAPLRPTVHAALPQNIDDYWFAPRAPASPAKGKKAPLSDAAAAYADGDFAAALVSARQALSAGGPLDVYAQFYVGQAQLRMANAGEAGKAFDAVLARHPVGYLALGARLGKAEAAEQRGDPAAAADLYAAIASEKFVQPEDGLSRLARAAQAAGDRKRAAEAWLRVYYEFPLSEAAKSAQQALESLQDLVIRVDDKLDLGRAQRLFGARRYDEARDAFQALQPRVGGDDRELVDLRLAECDYFLKRYAAARDALRPYLDRAARRAEARFFYLGSLRGLGDADQAAALTRALVDEFPDSTWASEALNNLGTQYILSDEDDLAAATFKELYERFPSGPYAERAAWKYGWHAYLGKDYAEAARVFESASAAFPRSDYRPPFLYWSARAHDAMGDRAVSQARLRLVYADYMNSYYGRLAARRLSPQEPGLDPEPAIAAPEPAPVAAPPPTAPLIRQLLAAGLYDDALTELRYAQVTWGPSPAIDATMAWVYHERGDLRRAITVMRRAYPQFLAEGGESLPAPILQIIFPLTYWDSIKRQAAVYELDPYVIAALIAQESTFDPEAHSAANAYGLMQIVPATGRRLAVALGIRRFRTSMLTNGETNIRLGTLYFKRLVQQFGGTHYALASYNAGENRVVRWKAERPGMPQEEFIDDIPFPETANYVKRILGTAEDYRRLYAAGVKPAPKKKGGGSR